MLRKFFHKLLSLFQLESLWFFWRSGYLQKTGWLESFKLKQPVDANIQPIPWYTYPALEYIKQLDFSNKQVFEYGSGNSTIFWSTIAKKVISIENNSEWYEKVVSRVDRNTEIKLIVNNTLYVQEILSHGNFDIIVVDGSCRLECAQAAINRLNPGGMIILDNSDWHIKTAKFLRESNLIQVDMTGIGPINPYAWTTSFFIHRDFKLQPKGVNQPEHGAGALKQYKE